MSDEIDSTEHLTELLFIFHLALKRIFDLYPDIKKDVELENYFPIAEENNLQFLEKATLLLTKLGVEGKAFEYFSEKEIVQMKKTIRILDELIGLIIDYETASEEQKRLIWEKILFFEQIDVFVLEEERSELNKGD